MNPDSRPTSWQPPASDRAAGLAGLVAAIVPALAAAVSVSAALWLSTAVIVSVLASCLVAALVARRLPPAGSSLVVLLLAAASAGGFDAAASAWLPRVRADLGIYLPLAVVLTSGPVAAAVLGDAATDGSVRRAVARALAAGLAFLVGTGLTALAREALGAGTITIPGIAAARVFRLPALSEAPARGLLAPFAGLIAAGYLVGLVGHVRRRGVRSATRDSGREEAR